MSHTDLFTEHSKIKKSFRKDINSGEIITVFARNDEIFRLFESFF